VRFEQRRGRLQVVGVAVVEGHCHWDAALGVRDRVDPIERDGDSQALKHLEVLRKSIRCYAQELWVELGCGDAVVEQNEPSPAPATQSCE